ncbi:MAG: glycosyltransferase family protein [Rikenellaceae bacterium]
MKYIFVIQGEGRGHLTQALSMSQLLRKNGHTIEHVLVGKCHNREIPQFFLNKIECDVTQYDAPSMDYGRGGKSANIITTILQNSTPIQLNRYRKSIDTIHDTIERSDADVVINFYDLLLGATNILKRIHRPIISIGHQYLIDHPKFRHNDTTLEGRSFILKLNNMISSYGSYKRLALSFYPMERSFSPRVEVVPPLLRPEIFDLKATKGDYILGYMLNPAYLKEVIKWKRRNSATEVHIFWDKEGAEECREEMPGLWLHKLNDKKFLEYMAGAKGYVTTAGFESICEAIYMGKPTLMIPAHIEQEVNAADAHGVNAGEVANEFNLSLLNKAIENYKANREEFQKWVHEADEILLNAVTML